jgi:hypothetical protein
MMEYYENILKDYEMEISFHFIDGVELNKEKALDDEIAYFDNFCEYVFTFLSIWLNS